MNYTFKYYLGLFIVLSVPFAAHSLECLRGDLNVDGSVNTLDISPFVGVLTGRLNSEAETCAADINRDGGVTALDINPFVALLRTAQSCGDNFVEGSELCDGFDLADETCESLDFESGTLRCAVNCASFDTNQCSTGIPDSLPMTTANRISGVAPLAVIFDAVDTGSPFPVWQSGVIQPANGDYSELHYVWDFGDPASGSWISGRQNENGTYPSRNSAVGYLAGHVFEAPGTYTVRLEVKDAYGTIRNYSQEIDVLNATNGWTIYYVSAQGNDSNNGQSPSSPFRTFGKAMSMTGPQVKVLFRRADTFVSTSSSEGQIRGAGPGIIGAYGSGVKPRITRTHSGTVFHGQYRPDWRVQDLNIDASGQTGNNAFAAFGELSLVQRCDSQGAFGTGYGVASNDLMVVDSTFHGNRYGVYSPPRTRFVVQGSDFDQGGGSHFIRTYVTKLLIAHNHFGEDVTGSGNHAVKMCGNEQPDELPARYNILSDNLFTNPGLIGWIVAVGPENANKPQKLTDVVIERNAWDLRFSGGDGIAITSRGADRVTVRNNLILEMPGGFLLLSQPVPGFSTWQSWRVYNNTYLYTGTNNARFLDSLVPLANWELKNNIAYFPNASGYAVRVTVVGSSFMSNYNAWHLPEVSTPFRLASTNYSWSSWRGAGYDAA